MRNAPATPSGRRSLSNQRFLADLTAGHPGRLRRLLPLVILLTLSTGLKVTAQSAAERSSATKPAAGESKEAQVTAIGSRRELFVESALVEQIGGEVRLQLHHPVPREIVLVHDAPWEGTSSGYHTVIQDGDLYRMYYRGSQLRVDNGRLITNQHKPVTCYAESSDGIHWTKPKLGIVEFAGSRENNIIWDGVGVHNFAVFRDSNPDCPAESRFKALAGLKGEGGLFAFHSADGIHWTQTHDTPVITNGAFDSQNLAFWDSERGEYRAYWRYFTKGVTEAKDWRPAGIRAVRTARSDDFLNWTEEADLTYEDSPPAQLYTNQVAPYHRAPHLVIGIPTRYIDRGWSESMRALPEPEHRQSRAAANQRYGTAITEVLLMASRDRVRFKRWNETFIRPGIERPGTWIYGQQFAAWHVVETESSLAGAARELSIYCKEGAWTGTQSEVRRYTLRIDGFVSAQATARGGELITKPITFEGDALHLNFSTSAAGSIRVELQGPDGTAYPGFSLDDCDELFGDTLARPVSWKQKSDVSALQGRPVRLRFVMSDADLFAYQFVSKSSQNASSR